ncbi:type II toxin-antitoxin system PemK/MazF family toxin [Rathayibacter sp. CAU 1779]
MSEIALAPGLVVWAALDPVIGREQAGRRPVLVVAGNGYLNAVTSLALVVPITSVDRSWNNHVRIDDSAGLIKPSWAMTEQLRAISRERIVATAGTTSVATLAIVRLWLSDFLEVTGPAL